VPMTINQSQQKTVAIIGGGPAGLMAAETLATAGHAVSVYEQMPTLGRKFLMAGRGGLNLTHSEPQAAFMARYRDAADWLLPSMATFTPGNVLAWCEELGQETFFGSSGRAFPKSMKASPLLRAWRARLDELGVVFHLRHRWTGWNEAGQLCFETPQGQFVADQADATLLALGGASWPRLGSDGNWVSFVADRGVDIVPFCPSNCGVNIKWTDLYRERFAGTPIKNIALSVSDETMRGEAMITAHGLEGGAVYALARPLRDALQSGAPANVSVDLRPNQTIEAITERLKKVRKGQSLSNMLKKSVKLTPAAIGLMREAGIDLPREPAALAALIKALPLSVQSQRGLDRAISSAGGIARDAVDENLMLKAVPGIFVAGEMLDWEAPTGGYLLQACFSTGVAAGEGIEDWFSEADH
jgi:uncharacterized flavoprotein (TIGR03862 family)